MKKNIIYIVVLILACALTGTITYIVLDNIQDNNKTNENDKQNQAENNNDIEQENDDKNEEENKNDDIKVVISEEKLKEYLSYIPSIQIDATNYVYSKKSIDLNDIDEKVLIGTALGKSINEETDVINKTDISLMLKKMYNKSSITINNSNCGITDGTYYYDFDGTNFEVCDYTNYPEVLNAIEEYNVNDDILTIYSYHAQLIDYYEEGSSTSISLNDIYNDTTKIYDTDKVDIDNDLDEFFENHKADFTQYKHTYKKNDTGYYWYSTEVVES